FSDAPCPSRSTPMTSRPTSPRMSTQPGSRHVFANEEPNPWTSAIGGSASVTRSGARRGFELVGPTDAARVEPFGLRHRDRRDREVLAAGQSAIGAVIGGRPEDDRGSGRARAGCGCAVTRAGARPERIGEPAHRVAELTELRLEEHPVLAIVLDDDERGAE